MSDQVYKRIELIGTSATSIEDAVNTALAQAGKSVRHMRWFEVNEIRGAVRDGQVAQWQVGVKLGFTVDD